MKFADMCGCFGNDIQLFRADGRGGPFQFHLGNGQRRLEGGTVKTTGIFDNGFVAAGGDVVDYGPGLCFHCIAGIMSSGKAAEKFKGSGIAGGLYFEQAAGHDGHSLIPECSLCAGKRRAWRVEERLSSYFCRSASGRLNRNEAKTGG